MEHVFSFVDGREVRAATPVELFEGLRRGERFAPRDLGRYLDLIRSRAMLGFGINIDVGAHASEVESRCQLAFESLCQQGWIRKIRRVSQARPDARAVNF